jgi:hypothetical protein
VCVCIYIERERELDTLPECGTFEEFVPDVFLTFEECVPNVFLIFEEYWQHFFLAIH